MKFEVTRYFTTLVVEANSAEEAYIESEKVLYDDEDEILANLETWNDADEVERIEIPKS